MYLEPLEQVRRCLTPAIVAGMASERFAGRVALVSGGGRGIGRAVAEALAAEGARVAVLARSRAQVDEVAAATGGLGVCADVADADAVQEAVLQVRAELGPPTLVVAAAGISPVRQRAEAHDAAAFASIMDVNVDGAFNLCRAAAPGLLLNGGSVVLVASTTALRASPRIAGYGASKAAVVHLGGTLAREWADRGVRVNSVCPGYVETEMTETMLAVPHLREGILAETPLGRLGTLDDVVQPTLFLLSDAASYVTGAVLPVDGGMAT